MSLIEKKQLEGCRMEFKIKVDGEEFAKGLDKSYQVNAPRLNVPGFRKGKAPKNLVIKTYGIGVLFDEAIKETYPAAYEEVISAEGFEPVDYPEVEIEDIDESGYTFKATVTGKPPVKLGKYKGLTAVKESPAVEESEIDNEIENLRDRNSRMVDIEVRPVEDGDIVIIDYCGKVGGEAFQGGTAEKQQLEIGSGQFIPGFEEQIKGHTPNPEEPFDITVTFPEGYPAEELSGKEAVFTITLHAIKKNEKPIVDDEFIKDISDEFETVEAFRAEIRKGLEQQKLSAATRSFEDALLGQVTEAMEVEIPAVMVERQIDNQVESFKNQLSKNGLTLEMYLQLAQMKMEDFRKNFAASAEKNVKTTLALEEIVKLENIAISDEEFDAELVKLAEQYGMEKDKIREMVDKAALCADIAMNKAVDVVTSSAKEKKPAAKRAKGKAEDGEESSEEDASAEESEKPKKAKKAQSKTEEEKSQD
ncbi:Trigger factor [bioreactor metagenome]|uniref:peptidylprolyl isomerase n=1 Tax=bioreactor metagenome TaxID=1076179 RepID=A0A644WZS5_9ZZZZ